MRPQNEKAPGPAVTGSGAGTSTYEKLHANSNADTSAQYSELLRKMQRVVAGMAAAADRLDRSARSLLWGAP